MYTVMDFVDNAYAFQTQPFPITTQCPILLGTFRNAEGRPQRLDGTGSCWCPNAD